MQFKCSRCGKLHETEDISFGADAPVQWDLLSDEERANSELTGETCMIEAEGDVSFYVRACLEIPIRQTGKAFTWGVWVSLSEKSMREMAEHWEDEDRTNLGPYFGWLCTKIPEYADTVFLKTMVHQRPVGQRPFVILDKTDHQLSVDQRAGISPQRMQDIIVKVLHS
jgi:hypothetical protein